MGGKVAAFVAVDAFRWVIPVLAGVAALAAILTEPGTAAENLVAGAAVAPFVLWAIWPRRVPSLAVVVAVGAAELFAQRSGDLEPLMFLVCISGTVIGISESRRFGVVFAGLAAVVITVVVAEVADDEILYGVWIMGVLLSLVLGFGFRRQLELATELSAAREALAHQVVLDEKQRIARDVHDLVGHGLAAVMLHVTGARHVLRRDVDAADEALADAETVGHRSLQELRRTLTFLRSSDDTGEFAPPPLPDASNIADAVEAARVLGLDAAYTADGDLRRVDPIVGLSLHRVAEEALNNARRHAPRAVTDIRVAVEDDRVALTVESIGPLDPDHDSVQPGDLDRPRYGLVGMRERMAAVGGELEAGPTRTGWSVRARAPIAPMPPIAPAAPVAELEP